MPGKNKTDSKTVSEQRADLDARYGKIGISAVAAALRYMQEAKSAPAKPVAPRFIEGTDDAAA